MPRVAPQAAAVADGESRVAVGAERGRRGGWRKQSPQLSVEEGGDSAGAVSRFSEEHFISTARERAWMLKLGNGGQRVFYLDNPRDYEQT